MPAAVALVGAAASVSAGVAAGGIIGGVMIAGGVMTGLGAVTGNKKLMKFGGILGLAGGVAGLASGAWSASAGTVAEQAARESFRAAELGAQSAAEALGGAAGGIADAAGSLVQANAGALGTTDIGIGAASAGGITPTPMTPGIAGPTIPGPTSPSIPSSVNLTNAGGTMQTAAKAAESGSMLSSIGDKVKPAFDWMEKNPRITQAGAGLLTAGLSGIAQQEALKEQMRQQDEQQARARKRLSDSVAAVEVPVYQRKGG